MPVAAHSVPRCRVAMKPMQRMLVQIVAHRRVEDPALAVGDGPDHRFVFAGAAFALVRIGGGQQMDMLDRAAHAVV